MEKQIPWNTGSGNITLTYLGLGNGTIIVTTDENLLRSSRSETIAVKAGSLSQNVTITQAACPLNFKSYDGYYIKSADNKMFNVQDVN